MKRILCRLLGHKWKQVDYELWVCQRCYEIDNDWLDDILHDISNLNFIALTINRFIGFCTCCKKIDRLFGKNVGNHNDCIPF